MLWLAQILNSWFNLFYEDEDKDEQVELYDDRFWPWFRCFIWIWIVLGVSGAAALFYQVSLTGAAAHLYSYGIIRFWVFYTPVFGFFMQAFYEEYASDGSWTPGPSYRSYIRNFWKDIR